MKSLDLMIEKSMVMINWKKIENNWILLTESLPHLPPPLPNQRNYPPVTATFYILNPTVVQPFHRLQTPVPLLPHSIAPPTNVGETIAAPKKTLKETFFFTTTVVKIEFNYDFFLLTDHPVTPVESSHHTLIAMVH